MPHAGEVGVGRGSRGHVNAAEAQTPTGRIEKRRGDIVELIGLKRDDAEGIELAGLVDHAVEPGFALQDGQAIAADRDRKGMIGAGSQERDAGGVARREPPGGEGEEKKGEGD